MNTITTDPNLVAYCGLYCGACGAYQKGRCPGCRQSENRAWCKVRTCCITHNLETCASCATFTDPCQCTTYHNFISRFFGFIFRSNRPACIARIRAIGTKAFAAEMAAARRQSLPR